MQRVSHQGEDMKLKRKKEPGRSSISQDTQVNRSGLMIKMVLANKKAVSLTKQFIEASVYLFWTKQLHFGTRSDRNFNPKQSQIMLIYKSVCKLPKILQYQIFNNVFPANCSLAAMTRLRMLSDNLKPFDVLLAVTCVSVIPHCFICKCFDLLLCSITNKMSYNHFYCKAFLLATLNLCC